MNAIQIGAIIGVIVCVPACYFVAKAYGKSGAWALAGIFGLIGLIFTFIVTFSTRKKNPGPQTEPGYPVQR